MLSRWQKQTKGEATYHTTEFDSITKTNIVKFLS
jgi:hypothetical protein